MRRVFSIGQGQRSYRLLSGRLIVALTVGVVSMTPLSAGAANPSCGMGAGIPHPPRPPKNSGVMKIAPGLEIAPTTKQTKQAFSGTLDNCMNFPSAPKTGTPIVSGSMKLRIVVPPGASCNQFVSGAPVKASLQVKWNALANGKSKTVAQDKFKAIATYQQTNVSPIHLQVTTGPIADPKSLFVGNHLSLDIVLDESQATFNSACISAKGATLLHFTGVSGASTITVLP